MRISRAFSSFLLAGGILVSQAGAAEGDKSEGIDVDASFYERGVQIQLEARKFGSENRDRGPRREGADQAIPDRGEARGTIDVEPEDRPGVVAPDVGLSEDQSSGESAMYCVTGLGSVDADCQATLGSLPDPIGCMIGGALGRSPGESVAPVCVDETPEPVDEEPVIEEAVEVAEQDDGPDIAEIIEQIPGLVNEEFATLPIDGGSVEFEEELLGFGYINRHTNVFADVEDQTFQRTMLGIDVEIRAVPIDYHFSYGDGTTLSTADPGESAVGQTAALTDAETATSHEYQDTGIFNVEVDTTFTGEYRIADGTWNPIADSATISAEPGEADIWRTESRHVSGTCEDPSQWGCNGPFTLEGDDSPPKIFAEQYDDAGNWRGP